MAVTRTTALNPRVDSRFNARSATNRAPVLNPRGDARFDARSANRSTARLPQASYDRSRVIAQHSAAQHPNWDRRRDHNWNGHRCHWHNNHWVIYGLGYYPFYPWGWYGYDYGYPYGSYYDDRYYDDGYAANQYSQSEYGVDSTVGQVQSALAREGYYRGAIDGSVGPATRNAIRRYQSNHGLEVNGQIDRPVLEALGLG